MPLKIGVFYGSDTGNNQEAAEKIVKELAGQSEPAIDVADADPHELEKYDLLFMGVPTCSVGEMQVDMENFVVQLDHVDLAGKTVALFGLGDAVNYSDNFLDGMGELWTRLKQAGAMFVGQWPHEGYEFIESLAVSPDNQDWFVGLGLDEDNEPELTDERIHSWVRQVMQEVERMKDPG
jgi:flavodoxin long chain